MRDDITKCPWCGSQLRLVRPVSKISSREYKILEDRSIQYIKPVEDRKEYIDCPVNEAHEIPDKQKKAIFQLAKMAGY